MKLYTIQPKLVPSTLWQNGGRACLPAGLPAGQAGFTLVETMVAIALLTIAIVAPMSLTVQSLATAYYARDEIIASNLAQEGIEAIRSVRDANILLTAEGTPTNLYTGIPIGTYFTVDAHTIPTTLTNCFQQPCSKAESTLQTNGQLYGYNVAWTTTTNFQRSAIATVVRSDAVGEPQEIRIAVTVTWATGSIQSRSFVIYENLYRWINDGSGT